MTLEPKVDLCFRVMGSMLPVDHGFALYSALSKISPALHEDEDIALKLVRGRYAGNGMLDISPHSELVLRLKAGRISEYIKLAGKRVEVMGQKLMVGTPYSRLLVPANVVFSQLVTTKNGNDQDRFDKEIARQIGELGIEDCTLENIRRRTFQVHGKQVVGYTLLISNLSPESSITIQESGLGGRRKMGCGFFEKWEGE